jgi:hypothetical protein
MSGDDINEALVQINLLRTETLTQYEQLMGMIIDLQNNVNNIVSTGEKKEVIGVSEKKVSTPGVGGSRYWARMPFMSSKSAVRMGLRQAALLAHIPYAGIAIGAGFMVYEEAMKEIARRAVVDALREYEKESMAERKLLVEDTVRKLEQERRESYRSVVP